MLVMLTRMALDPDDGIFRSAIASSLAWFARRLQPRELASARNNVLELLRQLSRSEQFAAIRLLFSATCGNRWFVTSLCYALLIDAEDSGVSLLIWDGCLRWIFLDTKRMIPRRLTQTRSISPVAD